MNLRIGTRPSLLARQQTFEVITALKTLHPSFECNSIPIITAGDLDKLSPLELAADNFFTGKIEESLVQGLVDMAVHSAKDLPPYPSPLLSTFLMPNPEDPRDVVVTRDGQPLRALPKHAVIGVSSPRRRAFIEKNWPQFVVKSIRGNVDERIKQVDEGRYDAIITAAAAMHRLKLQNRIAEYIHRIFLPTPHLQGFLALQYRSENREVFNLLKPLLTPCLFVGAGPGDPELISVKGQEAISNATCILYDRLANPRLLWLSDAGCELISVGKGNPTLLHNMPPTAEQGNINQLLVRKVKEGHKVVRLKGGDTGIYARISEEIAALEGESLPFQIIPGISSLSACAQTAGFSLTDRERNPGFSVVTGHTKEYASAADAIAKPGTPLVLFMGVTKAEETVEKLLQQGYEPQIPVTVVENGTLPNQRVVTGVLSALSELVKNYAIRPPALLYIGYSPDFPWFEKKPLHGKTVAITASSAIGDKQYAQLSALGAQVVEYPTIALVPQYIKDSLLLEELHTYDWLLVTSQNSVHFLIERLEECGRDIRSFPKNIMAIGPSTARILKEYHIATEYIPENHSLEGLQKLLATLDVRGQRFFIPISNLSNPGIAGMVSEVGGLPTLLELYRTESVQQQPIQEPFDLVTFCSGSAVRSFFSMNTHDAIGKAAIAVIGKPTATALAEYGLQPVVVAKPSTTDGLVQGIVEYFGGK
ncbi:MAG: uroporphyrinogen-III C-methyltransferase [bacterium]